MTNAEREARIGRLAACFREFGAPEPRSWAESEVNDDCPELARFLFLRSLWPQSIDAWRQDLSWIDRYAENSRPVRELLEAGIDRKVLGTIAATVAFEVVLDLLMKLHEGYDPDAPRDYPGWALVETDAEGRVTGRELARLHEELARLDPSGAEAGDLLL